MTPKQIGKVHDLIARGKPISVSDAIDKAGVKGTSQQRAVITRLFIDAGLVRQRRGRAQVYVKPLAPPPARELFPDPAFQGGQAKPEPVPDVDELLASEVVGQPNFVVTVDGGSMRDAEVLLATMQEGFIDAGRDDVTFVLGTNFTEPRVEDLLDRIALGEEEVKGLNQRREEQDGEIGHANDVAALLNDEHTRAVEAWSAALCAGGFIRAADVPLLANNRLERLQAGVVKLTLQHRQRQAERRQAAGDPPGRVMGVAGRDKLG